MAGDPTVAVLFTAEELAEAMMKSTGVAIAAALRALPRVTHDDGSLWVDAEKLDDMATRLEAI
jgi:hypothetical protein